jgi:hypothetical protein
MPLTPDAFVEKWTNAQLSERSASHEHFIDLCQLLGVPTPASDPDGNDYCFEKAVTVVGPASRGSKGEGRGGAPGGGFVDVWKRGHFAWEYKRKDKYKDLNDAYRQLYQYRDALDNPPLSVVCDISTTIIHTHFTGYPKDTQTIKLAELPSKLNVLKRLFTDPDSFRRTLKRSDELTEEVADEFKKVADNLANRLVRQQPGPDDVTHHDIAHFLMKVIFCLFAEDIGLLPGNLFTRTINRACQNPDDFPRLASSLFSAMRSGGEFGADLIPWFNGGLFDDKPALPLAHGNLLSLQKVAQKDWGGVAPHIFGTLFERLLDPSKRAQIGAHYTSKDDILLVIEPVVLAPLRREFEALKEKVAPKVERPDSKDQLRSFKSRATKAAALLTDFRRKLGSLKVLDPACGSGNFLYITLQQLLDLDAQIVSFAAQNAIPLDPKPFIKPTQFCGIEINPYAAELAQVVLWIGYIQWLSDRGIDIPNQPILDKLECIKNEDAILDLSNPKHPAPAKWDPADFIVGNPPFLGSKLFRKNGIPDDYLTALFSAYADEKGSPIIPRTSDLCCYWFELARRAIESNPSTRAGLLATQGIRGKDNRSVLERIKATGDIFMAWSDREWILDGASVHVSMIGFDSGIESDRTLDGKKSTTIDSDLEAGAHTSASALNENHGIAFQGGVVVGQFDITPSDARRMLREKNPHRRPNTDVIRLGTNGKDITARNSGWFIIDFGQRTHEESSMYEAPFEHVERYVRPHRAQNRDRARRERWWQHGRPNTELRSAVASNIRQIATARVAKHRIYQWLPSDSHVTDLVISFARSDDYFFGVLHSSIHELWARRMGTQLREAESGFRYTPTTCFETFPLPWPPGREPAAPRSKAHGARSTGPSPAELAAHKAISAAAAKLHELRENWLNPPEWIELIARKVDESDDFSDLPADARPLIRQATIAAEAAKDTRLKKRTLTNLYNERPAWLKHAHEALDRAVLSAYAATDPEGHWNEDAAEVWRDSGAGQPLPAKHPLSDRRAETDQKVLANLLRLNHTRAEKTSKTPPSQTQK